MMDTTSRSERRWQKGQLPVTHLLKAPTSQLGFDFGAAMTGLCRDVARCLPGFAHLDMTRVLVSATINRKRSKHGLQARVTPLRFRDGALLLRHRGSLYGLERYHVGDVEMLYLLTFVVPRFLNQAFEEKLTTVVHELYHMSPAFDGDLRRFGARGTFHTHSKKNYDAGMKAFADEYHRLAGEKYSAFLRWNFEEYQRLHGGIRVVVVPRPRMIRIGERDL